MPDLSGLPDPMKAHVAKLRAKLAREARLAHDDLERTSTLPLDALDLDDPMLEAALTDSAMRFFLKHMTSLDADDFMVGDEPMVNAETVDSEEMQRTIERCANMDCAVAPDPLEGLEEERLWILIDLLVHGDSHSRRRATLELRDVASSIENSRMDPALVDRLREGLGRLEERPLILDLVYHTTRAEAEE